MFSRISVAKKHTGSAQVIKLQSALFLMATPEMEPPAHLGFLPLDNVHGAVGDVLHLLEGYPALGIVESPAIGGGDFTGFLVVADNQADVIAGA